MSDAIRQPAIFSERLAPKMAGILPLLLLVPAVWLVSLPFLESGWALLLGASVFFLCTVARIVTAKKLTVTGGMLLIGARSFSKDLVTDIEVLDKYQARTAMGPELRADAILFFASSANYALKISLDQKSGHPYALISTNKPEALKRALRMSN